MTNTETELKPCDSNLKPCFDENAIPCPFCAEKQIYPPDDSDEFYRCSNCGAHIPWKGLEGHDDDVALVSWNTRPAEAALQARIEELEAKNATDLQAMAVLVSYAMGCLSMGQASNLLKEIKDWDRDDISGCIRACGEDARAMWKQYREQNPPKAS